KLLGVQTEVVLRMSANRPLRLGNFFAPTPYGMKLGQRDRHRRILAEAVFQRRTYHLFQQTLQRRLVGRVGQFHQHVAGMTLLERLLHAIDVRQHEVQTFVGKELESLQTRTAGTVDAPQQFQRLLGRRHGRQHHGAHLYERQQLERYAGNHAQRALRTDKQLLEVVTGVVLTERLQAIEDLAR